MNDEEFDKMKQLQEIEQGMALLADTFPRLWWQMFTKLKEAGFKENEALELVKVYIQTTASSGG